MKLTTGKKGKVVTYFGVQLSIPIWVEWLVTNEDGEVYGCLSVPHQHPYANYWDTAKNELAYRICDVDLEGMDWKKTLQYVGE